jgi:hypothetical protein
LAKSIRCSQSTAIVAPREAMFMALAPSISSGRQVVRVALVFIRSKQRSYCLGRYL